MAGSIWNHALQVVFRNHPVTIDVKQPPDGKQAGWQIRGASDVCFSSAVNLDSSRGFTLHHVSIVSYAYKLDIQ